MKHDHLSAEGFRGRVAAVDAHDVEPKTVCHKRLRRGFANRTHPSMSLMEASGVRVGRIAPRARFGSARRALNSP